MLNDYLPLITLSSPGQIAFQLGNLTIRWYGIFIAVAFLTSYFLGERIAKRNNLNVDVFNDLIFYILISGVLFARLYFVLLSWDYFKDHISEIPKIWLGGQSIHGGILGTIIAVLIYSKVKKISFYSYIDLFSVMAPLGQAIGRWGNFFNNEAFGKPVVEIGKPYLYRLYIPLEYRPENYINYKYFHPTFLYESIIDFIIFIFLYRNYSKWKTKAGKTFWVYLLFYSIIRFFLEFLRVDSLCAFGNIPFPQIISVIISIVAIVFLIKK